MREGVIMKSLKTYNLDQDVIRILASQPNKSQYVSKAVRDRSNKSKTFSGQDAETKDLIRWLLSKDDVSDSLKALLKLEYFS